MAKFEKGKSGNPTGTNSFIAKKRVEIRKQFAMLAPEAFQVLQRLLLSDDEKIQITAAKEVLDRGIGKATEIIELTGENGGPIETRQLVDRARGETPEEWLKRTRK